MDETFIETLKNNISKNMDNPDYLSKAVIDLARWTYYYNTKVAEAELKEREAYLDSKDDALQEGKKLTNDEAEALALKQTGNKYGLLKLNRESDEHLINALKVRIRVLLGEKENTKLE